MADSNSATPAPAADSGVQGTEFSRPTGANDEAVWQKHFGTGSKESKGERSKESSKSESKEPAKSRTRDSGSDSKSDSKPTAKAPKDEKSKASSEAREKPEPTKSKETSSSTKEKLESKPKKDDGSEATGRKTAERGEKDEPADPEEPSKKARDLFEAAKKADDPKEARRLYKRAMKEAFGEVPEEFDDGKYAAIRRERKAASAAIDEKAKRNEGRFNEAVEKLKPAIYVMRQLEGAGIADRLTVPLVEKAISVVKALRGLEDGDYTQLAEVVSKATGLSHDEAMKNFVKGVRISPEGRAARAQAEQAQRDNQALRERLQALERQLEEGKTQQTEAQKRAEHQKRVEENRTLYLDQITDELADHPVLKLNRGAERVMAYIIRDAKAKGSKSATMTFETAANRIVASERRRREETRVLDDGGDPPEREERSSVRSIGRTETRDAGVRSEDPEAAFERIFTKHTSAGGRRR